MFQAPGKIQTREFTSTDNQYILRVLRFSEQINHENQTVGDYFNRGELMLRF